MDVVVAISLVDTAFGPVGLACTEKAVLAVHLPESSAERTLAELRGSLRRRQKGRAVGAFGPGLAEASIADSVTEPQAGSVAGAAAAGIVALLDGEEADLSEVPVAFGQISPFTASVYELVRAIPRGETLTYGEVAARAGAPSGAQAVGRAMGDNPVPLIMPCHRVVGADQRLVGFSAAGGVDTKRRLLVVEGCPTVQPSLFDGV